MGQTNRKYPIREVALSLENAPDNDSGTERKKLGDVVVVRNPHFVIGRLEAKPYLWLRLEGLEENEFSEIKLRVHLDGDDAKERFDKCRYRIPLHRLKQVFPAFDIARAVDLDDIYQPFLTVDEDNYFYLTEVKPFQVSGLVFDKATGEYL